MGQGTLDRLRRRQAGYGKRASSSMWRVAYIAIPLLLLVTAFFGYRYYMMRTTIVRIREIVAEARAYNVNTLAGAEKIEKDPSQECSDDFMSRLEYSAQVAQVLGAVLATGGLLPNESDPGALPDINLPEFNARESARRRMIVRDSLVVSLLINRQCDMIEERLDVSEADLIECLLAGDLVMLTGAVGLIDQWELLQARRSLKASDAPEPSESIGENP